MLNFTLQKDKNTNTEDIKTALCGAQLLANPFLNKGTAFSYEEREKFDLLGLLPEKIETLVEQVARAYLQLKTYSTPLQQTRFLYEIYATNRVLFYKLIKGHIAETLPLIYTPHIAKLVQNFSREFRNPAGLYLNYNDRDKLATIFAKFPEQIDLIVVTDGERVLGIGDQGVGGIYIAVAKSVLYTVFGGIRPWRILPVILDVGTNNEKLLNDPMYLGLKQNRINNLQYIDFIKDFVGIVCNRYPTVVLQWEDFGKSHAALLLRFFRDRICSFNDDIQGTAVVTLATLLLGMRKIKRQLMQQKIVIFGAGSAGIGIADLICAFLEGQGMSAAEAKNNIWLIDREGLLTDKSLHVTGEQQQYLHSVAELDNWHLQNSYQIKLLDVITNVKPQVLIGCSGGGGTFTQDVIMEMAKHISQPIILPLSNPNEKSEAQPQDLMKWTQGRALIATGSPYINIAQCNNALAFPGIGFGAIISKARKITTGMLLAACHGIINYSLKNCEIDQLLPDMQYAEQLAQEVAYQVAKQAQAEGVAVNVAEIAKRDILKFFWQSEYLNIVD